MAKELGDGAGSGYPGSIDVDENQESASTSVRYNVPNDLASAVIAVQTALGVNPFRDSTNVVTYLSVEHIADGTHDNTVVAMLAGSQTFTGDKTFTQKIY